LNHPRRRRPLETSRSRRARCARGVGRHQRPAAGRQNLYPGSRTSGETRRRKQERMRCRAVRATSTSARRLVHYCSRQRSTRCRARKFTSKTSSASSSRPEIPPTARSAASTASRRWTSGGRHRTCRAVPVPSHQSQS
jgi:hypothetical protein